MSNQQKGKTPEQHGSAGTGSAEQTGRSRSEQQQGPAKMDAGNEELSKSLGRDKQRLSSIEELGGRSGRDDYAGGSGDDMSSQSTGDATDR